MKSAGLGDTLDKISTAIGLKAFVVNNFEDCGCEARKAYLNKVVPYNYNSYKKILKIKL